MLSVINPALLLVEDVRWYGRTLVSEVRSFAHRIRILSRRRRHRDPIDLGPMFEESPTGELVPCKATLARTQYIEFLLARFPWASDADVLLALDGWDKATRCTPDNSDIASMREMRIMPQHTALRSDGFSER